MIKFTHRITIPRKWINIFILILGIQAELYLIISKRYHGFHLVTYYFLLFLLSISLLKTVIPKKYIGEQKPIVPNPRIEKIVKIFKLYIIVLFVSAILIGLFIFYTRK